MYKIIANIIQFYTLYILRLRVCNQLSIHKSGKRHGRNAHIIDAIITVIVAFIAVTGAILINTRANPYAHVKTVTLSIPYTS